MIVVIQFCAKDAHLCIKNLEWCNLWNQPAKQNAVLAFDSQVPLGQVDEIRRLSARYFPATAEILYSVPKYNTWPWAPNHAWQQVATKIPQLTNDSWFWWEADTTPLRMDWLDVIEAEHRRGGKPFTGHIVQGVVPGGHMTGVGVYPNNVIQYTQEPFMMTREKCIAWDVAMAKEMMRHAHPANDVLQHVWAVDDSGKPTLGGNTLASFKDWNDVTEGPHRADFRCATYHRCKDGTLVDILVKKALSLQVGPAMAARTHITQPEEPAGMVGWGDEEAQEQKKADGTCEMLMVTYYKDFDWMYYAIKCINKFCSGFQGLTIAMPRADVSKMDMNQKPPKDGIRVRIWPYDEIPGKGMVQHMDRILHADEIIPDADFILHLDADCMFKEPVTPNEYIHGKKPVYVYRTYESMVDKDGIQDNHQWKAAVEKALGEEPKVYTMCRHPSCFPRGMYAKLRAHLEKVQGVPVTEYIMAQKNDFPQTFAEFPTVGAWAWKYAKDGFVWHDCSDGRGPKDKLKAYWSHAGLDGREDTDDEKPTPRQEIEAFLLK